MTFNFEGSPVIISKNNIVFLYLKIDYVFTNSTDPDEMPHNAAFHQGLQSLLKYSTYIGVSGPGITMPS